MYPRLSDFIVPTGCPTASGATETSIKAQRGYRTVHGSTSGRRLERADWSPRPGIRYFCCER